jgi:hypothetical protein
MSNFLTIQQGGRIRYNAIAALPQTWSRGQCLTINSNGQLELLSTNNLVYSAGATGPVSGSVSQVLGIALEQCLASTSLQTGGNVIQNTAIVFGGNTGSILLGEAVVITDNLSGTGGWVPGLSNVYAQAGGNYSYNSTSGLQVGRALSNPASNGRLEFLFRPPLGC